MKQNDEKDLEIKQLKIETSDQNKELDKIKNGNAKVEGYLRQNA
jgi:hypothetical protein